MALLAAVAARSPLTLAGSWGWVIEVAEHYCSTSICRLQLINARPERSRQCQPQHRTPTSYWSLGKGTWVCAHWSAVSQAEFFQEHTPGSRSTQPGERGKFLRWEGTRSTPEVIQKQQQTALWLRKNQIWHGASGFWAGLFSLAGIRQALQLSQGWVTTAVPWGLTFLSHFPPF